MATLTTLRASILDALDYEETGSLTKAKQVVSLCRKLMVVTPLNSSAGGSNVGWDVNQIKTIKEEAQAYISANTAGSRTRFLGVQNDFGR
jgi:hypothetical protein